MRSKNANAILTLRQVVAVVSILAANVLAIETCPNNSNGPEICVDFAGDTPEINVDFLVDYLSNPANPTVTLRAGSETWNVRSRNDNGSAGSIGAIIIDASAPSDVFKVKIANGGSVGAATVGTIDLNDETNWTGHSSIVSGSKITGNVTGNISLKASGADGGDVDLAIFGSLEGMLVAPKVVRLLVGGAVTATGGLDIGEVVDGPEPVDVEITGAINGGITLGTINGVVEVSGAVSSPATLGVILKPVGFFGGYSNTSPGMVVQNISGSGASLNIDKGFSGTVDVHAITGGFVYLNGREGYPVSGTLHVRDFVGERGVVQTYDGSPSQEPFTGTIISDEGIPAMNVITFLVEMNGTVDLRGDSANNQPIAGELCICDGGMGSVSGVGVVAGPGFDSGQNIILGSLPENEFSGIVTLDALGAPNATGVIMTNGVADFSGKIDVTGNISNGRISIGGDVIAGEPNGGMIVVGGDVDVPPAATSSTIHIAGDMDGAIDIDGNLLGVIHVGGDSTAPVEVGNKDLDTGDVSGTIEVGGDFSGQIAIFKNLLEDGLIDIGGDFVDADSDYDLAIGGDWAGDVVIGGASGAEISIGDDVSNGGSLQIAGASSGPITIEGDLAGDLFIGEDCTGALYVSNDVTVSGSIDIDGSASGGITIWAVTSER